MKALADYVHSKGLKMGIYSSPGPKPVRVTQGAMVMKNRCPNLRRLGNGLLEVRPVQL